MVQNNFIVHSVLYGPDGEPALRNVSAATAGFFSTSNVNIRELSQSIYGIMKIVFITISYFNSS